MWYKHKLNEYPFWIAFHKNGVGFGTDKYGDWCYFPSETLTPYVKHYCKKATEFEVKDALVNEAKKRGYKGDFVLNLEDCRLFCNEEKIFDYGNWKEYMVY